MKSVLAPATIILLIISSVWIIYGRMESRRLMSNLEAKLEREMQTAATCEGDLKDIASSNTGLDKKLKEARSQVSAVQTSSNKLSSQIEEMRRENDGLKSKISELERENDINHKRLLDLQAKLTKSNNCEEDKQQHSNSSSIPKREVGEGKVTAIEALKPENNTTAYNKQTTKASSKEQNNDAEYDTTEEGLDDEIPPEGNAQLPDVSPDAVKVDIPAYKGTIGQKDSNGRMLPKIVRGEPLSPRPQAKLSVMNMKSGIAINHR